MAGHPHIITLPVFAEATEKSPDNARTVVDQWVNTFEKTLKDGSEAEIATLFHSDAWIRDLLGFSWDYRAIQSSTEIAKHLKQNYEAVKLGNIRPRTKGAFQPEFKSLTPDVHWVQSMFEFETAIGKGRGMLRLVTADDNSWKCYLINFTLEELKGYEEASGLRRPHGYVDPRYGTWGERRERQKEFLDEDPVVLVIGAGHSGLDIAARLRHVGLPTLIIERNERVGDNWRLRYRTLMTHGPTHYNHLPFIPFPSDWPMYMPKDKLADWLECYANLMELNVWTSTTIQTTEFDEKTKTWTVTVRRSDGSIRTIKPRHVVLATGQSGDAIVPSFPGQDLFKGTIYHGVNHNDASDIENLSQKRVVVVGSGNSSHDICQNYHEAGAAEVTMIQRGGSYIISGNKGVPLLYAGLYDEHGPPTEDADLFAQSVPVPVQFAFNVFKTQRISAADRELLDGLTKAGFLLDSGPDKSGINRKYITRGGGYYIDVGCSQLIVDGKVKVRQSPGGIESFDQDGLIFPDGSKLSADIVVLATGYDDMLSTARKLFGDKIADQVGQVWDLDAQGEVRAMWRNSGHPNLWFMGGNLSLCRFFSRLLALQIKAMEVGILN
ncbi:hypothetical protein G7Z17_g7272 [Cylindrodendrum hubeiense]|uniref:Flavin-containing monooxygenase n=1 Tax=Cylindrodendrum hubeiense TaxID=595255 RepID=A0A9P5H5U1_9HYPO|nr:hypothetical protein G7Z17_g7272 [Cylindrodendrum hubeiense]